MLKIFSGSSHRKLAEDVARILHTKLEDMTLKKFPCGEVYARPIESVRGADVFVIQTCTAKVNEDLMELFVILDALKRSFADKIHVVIPLLGYARQDRVALPREPISCKLVANLIAAAGADHVITVNLHSDQEQGFFDFPVDNLMTHRIFADYFLKKRINDLVVVAPDVGASKFAKYFADMLGADFALLHKNRVGHNFIESTAVIGDVVDRTCLIYDDMTDTAETAVNAKESLLKRGANPEVYFAATHPIFSDPAISRLKGAKFAEVIVMDTLPIPKEKIFDGLKVLSVADLLARTIQNVHRAKSVSSWK